MHAQEFPLRPLTMGELLDRAFSLYRQNFWKFVGTLAVIQVLGTEAQIVSKVLSLPTILSGINEGSTSLSRLTSYLILLLFGSGNLPVWLSIIKMVIFECLGTGALVYLVINAYLGKSLSIIQAYRETFKYSLKLVGARVYAEIVLVFTILLAFFSFIGWLALPGVWFLYAGIIIPMITIPVIIENQPITEALARMTGLVMQRFWWVVGVNGFIFLLSIIFLLMQTTLTNGISYLVLGTTTDQLIAGGASLKFVITQVVNMAGVLVVYPFQIIVSLFVYLELRTRFEGLDLVLTTEQLSNGTINLAEKIFSLPTPNKSSYLNWKNLGNVTILGLAFAFFILVIIWFLPLTYLFQ